MIIMLLITVALIAYGVFEYMRHQKNVYSIPIRILVNGTRGKSSVTRLITAGLRGGAMRVIGKTTGTAPRLIFTDGSETPVTRIGRANIIEQVKIFRVAASHSPDAIVAECMAVLPPNQRIMEHQMVHSTVGVITNVREDHLDEMGPTVEDVARSLSNTVPRNAVLYTCEKKYLHILEAAGKKRGTKVMSVDGSSVPDSVMENFSYVEHKENVALALAVCGHYNIPQENALEAMYASAPDPGVLRIYRVNYYGKEIEFVNAFAANDPDSYVMIWSLLRDYFIGKKIVVIVNCRKDRVQRTESLAALVAGKISGDHFVFAGEYTPVLTSRAVALGLSPSKIISHGGSTGEEVFNQVASLTDGRTIAVGIGNVVGFGDQVVRAFTSKGTEIVYEGVPA